MKKLVIASLLAVTLAACSPPVVSPQQAYVQACGTYGAAFSVALQLRTAGKLNQTQIDQITLVDKQVTPICTGALPADLTTAAQQIAKAITTLTVMEAAQQAAK
jgi:hypothetical protein